MTVYAIAQLKMTDRATYDRYQARFFDVVRGSDTSHPEWLTRV